MKTPLNQPDYFLDISDEVCPMTFVRTRLKIEKMNDGEILEVRLKGTEPRQNVPDSLTELGHRILSITPEDPDATDEAVRFYRVIVEKTVT